MHVVIGVILILLSFWMDEGWFSLIVLGFGVFLFAARGK